MISFFEAKRLILESTEPKAAVEVNCEHAFGMAAVEDVVSDTDIPPFNKSAMDGYAVRSQDVASVPVTLKVVDTIPAGKYFKNGLSGGECVKIMTGAPVPAEMDSVIMVENSKTETDGRVTFFKDCVSGRNICFQGEDVKKGETILKKGTMIKGPEIAILATAGRRRVKVIGKPEVATLSTGSEIVEPGERLPEGKIRNSNGPMLNALLRSLGCETEYLGIAGDETEGLRERIRRGFKKDILLLSGGVSVGDYDLVPEVLRGEGAEIVFHKVRIKPGKPLLFARKDKCLIFGIPGNPVSNYVAFFLYIKPAVQKMIGAQYERPPVDAIMDIDFYNKSDRLHIVPSRYTIKDGQFHMSPIRLNGSADIIGCSSSNCFALFECGAGPLRKGEKVKILLLDS
jgi:molybdopterin molybdotransferase